MTLDVNPTVPVSPRLPTVTIAAAILDPQTRDDDCTASIVKPGLTVTVSEEECDMEPEVPITVIL